MTIPHDAYLARVGKLRNRAGFMESLQGEEVVAREQPRVGKLNRYPGQIFLLLRLFLFETVLLLLFPFLLKVFHLVSSDSSLP